MGIENQNYYEEILKQLNNKKEIKDAVTTIMSSDIIQNALSNIDEAIKNNIITKKSDITEKPVNNTITENTDNTDNITNTTNKTAEITSTTPQHTCDCEDEICPCFECENEECNACNECEAHYYCYGRTTDTHAVMDFRISDVLDMHDDKYRVIVRNPYVIVFWEDNTITKVKCTDGETFDPEKGFAMAVLKKFFGNSYFRNMTKILNNAEEYTVEPFDRKISKDKKKSAKAARVEKAEKKSAKTEKKSNSNKNLKKSDTE